MTYFKTIALFCKLLVALTIALFNLGASAEPYFIHKNGAKVYDQATGLVWMRCSLGQVWSGSLCQGRIEKEQMGSIAGTVQEVNEKKLNGHGDWVLPSTRQLHSLISCEKFSSSLINVGDGGRSLPRSCERGFSIAKGAIPKDKNADSGDATWGSMPKAGRYEYADVWLVNFDIGKLRNPNYSDSKYSIKLVRDQVFSSEDLAIDWHPQ